MNPIRRKHPLSLDRGSPKRCVVRGLVAMLGAAGCQDAMPVPDEPITAGTMARYTTGEAAAALDPAGRFRLEMPAAEEVETSREQAEAFAALWPEAFGGFRKARLEREHGGPIDLNALVVCGRSYFVRSAYEPIDPAIAAVDGATRRLFGPWWLVTLCTPESRPQISLAVSAYSGDLRIEGNRLLLAASGGHWFLSEGIPGSLGAEFVASPERVVQQLARATGRKVARVPVLVAPAPEVTPNRARWLLDFDGDVRVLTGARGAILRRQLGAWRRPGSLEENYQAPAASQPEGVSFKYPTNLTTARADEPIVFEWGFARRRPDVPTRFETVTVAGEH